jgi:hypothetical protein
VGRPKVGKPPYKWEQSAEDALVFDKVHQWKDWSIPGMLYKLESYNGWSYRKPAININSPYLWSFTDKYSKGKFVKDHVYSATAVSKQVGAAAILRRLAEKKLLNADAPLSDRISLIRELGTIVAFAPSRFNPKAAELQRMLNLNGAHLNPDGKAGERTSDAYQAVTGSFLQGDPRA